jgi:hypothetical protein
MMLTADYTKIENYEEVVYRTDDEGNTQLAPLTHTLCMIAMIIGMDELTEKSLETWYERIRMYELINGSFFINQRTTRDMLRTHLGLKLNVSRMSKAKFKTQIYRMLEHKVRDVDRMSDLDKSLAS